LILKSSGKSSVKILEILIENPKATVSELAQEIGISTRAIEKQIQKLKESGKLIRSGGRKEGNWKVVLPE